MPLDLSYDPSWKPAEANPKAGPDLSYDPNWKPPAPPTMAGEFKKGFAGGVDALQGAGYGLAALAGDAAGLEGVKQWGLAGYQRNQQEQQANAPAVGRFEDIGGLKDAGLYAAQGLGQLAPFALSSVATGGLGGLAGRVLTQGAAKQAGERLLAEKAGEIAAGNMTKDAAGKLAQDAAGKVLTKGMERGALAGAAANSIGTEQGMIYGDIYEQTGQTAPGTAALYGLGAGLLDVIPGAGLIRKVAGRQATKGIVRETLGQAGKESATEAAQTVVERGAVARVDPSKEVFSPEGMSDIANAAVLGGLGGGVVGAGGRLVAGKGRQEGEPIAPPEQEQPPAASQAPVAPPSVTVEPAARLAELQRISAGTPDHTVTGPDGKPMTIPGMPGRFFTADERAEYQRLKSAQPSIDPNAGPLSRAASQAQQSAVAPTMPSADQTATAESRQGRADPLAERLAAVQDRMTPDELGRVAQGLGLDNDFVQQMQNASQIAGNWANARPEMRERALSALEDVFSRYDTRWGQPNAPEQSTAVVPAGPQMRFDPNTLRGEARDVTPGGDLSNPVNPNQLAAPTVRGIESPQARRTRIDADAAYEQAFQDLVKAEQLGVSDRELMGYQQALREAAVHRETLARQLADTDATVAGRQQTQTAQARRAVLDSVLNDPGTQNPLGRFQAELKRQGFSRVMATGEERQAIERFQNAAAAFGQPDAIPSTPNEMDAAALGIRERKAKAPQPAPQSVRALPIRNFDTAQRKAQEMSQSKGETYVVAQHPGGQPGDGAHAGMPAPGVREDVAVRGAGAGGGVAESKPDQNFPNQQIKETGNAPQIESPGALPVGQGSEAGAGVRGQDQQGAEGQAAGEGQVQASIGRGQAQGQALNGLPAAQPLAGQGREAQGQEGAAPRRFVSEDDAQRLTRVPEHAEDLRNMAQDAGWAEQGGRMLRDASGNVSRSKWLPRAEWFRAGMIADPAQARTAVDKAAGGQRMTAKEQRTVAGMVEWLEAQQQGRPLDENSSAYDFERAGYNAATPAERQAFDDAVEFLGATAMSEAEAERALGFTEEEIRELARTSDTQPGQAVVGQAQPRGPPESAWNAEEAFRLESPTEEGLRASQESLAAQQQREAEAQRQADEKAQADRERDSFTLTGSNRPADVQAAQGQGGLFEQPAPTQTKPENRKSTTEASPAQIVQQAEAIAPAPTESQQNPETEPITKLQDAAQQHRIMDFGEKIGGARKDTARPLGPRSRIAKEEDQRPAWARRIQVMQIQPSKYGSSATVGKWQIMQESKAMKGAVSPISRKVFDSEQEALDAIPLAVVAKNHSAYRYDQNGEAQYGIFRNITDRKRAMVKGGFASQEEAMRYMAGHPVEIIEHKFPFPEKPWLDRIERSGPEHRTGDVSPKMFQDSFGFRAGEFGNWNMGSDGQVALNHAYDALMDLADAIGVPPKAISLNGELAIAFGARGTGGKNAASAHYEPGARVINLTKIKGAGSAAHEWWHAVDHYFAQQGGRIGSASIVKDGASFKTEARQELLEAIKRVVDTMTTTERSTTTAAEQVAAGAAKRLERLHSDFDYRQNDWRGTLTDGRYTRNNKEATPEQLKQWDALMAKLRGGELGEEVYVENPSKLRGAMGFTTGANLRDANAIYKAVTGRSFLKNDPDSSGRRFYWTVKAIADNKTAAQAKEAVTTKRRAATDYVLEARKIDENRVGDYWSTPEELGARAFESYVFDKLIGAAKRSDYLVHAVENRYYANLGAKPYPEGAERMAINAAFDNLFATIQTRETEKGTTMFSRGAGAGMPLRDVQAVVDRVSKRMKNLPRVHVLESPAALSTKDPTQKALRDSIRAQDAWTDVEGAHHDGEIYLFASNLADEARAEHVLATHEVTHYGLRGAVGKDLDSALQAVWLTNPAVREAARAVKERTGIKSNVEAVEEVLADMPTADLVKLKGWRKVVQAVRNWLARIGATGMARRLTKLMMSGLDQQSQADVMVADLVNAARDWVRNGKQPDSLAAGTMFSFAGQNALTADRFALASAQDRLARGEDAETVRQETGWHRDQHDGKWKFEISDRDAELYGSEGSHFGDILMGGDTLAEVMSHPKLFAAYPQLRDVKVDTLPADSKSLGNFNVASNTIRIRENLTLDKALSAILHEAQHFVQREEEGFATGSNLRDAGSHGAYWNSAGEVEARNVQTRQKMTDEDRQGLAPRLTTDVHDNDVIVSWNGKEMASERGNPADPNAAKLARVDRELHRLEDDMRPVRGSDQAKAVRQEIVGKPLTNIETGMVATVSGMSFGKMLSKSNVDLSVSPQAHYQALGNLDKLFRLATEREARDSKKAPGTISAIHHFDVPMPFDGDVLLVKIMAKEFRSQQEGTRLYLVQAVEIEAPAAKLVQRLLGSQDESEHTPRAAGTSTPRLAQMIAAVKGDGSDTRFSRAGQSAATVANAARQWAGGIFGRQNPPAAPAAPSSGATWASPVPSKMDDVIYAMQDKQVDMRRVVGAIRQAVGAIADKWNPYLGEELFHGRSAKGVKDFLDLELRPLLMEMRMRGVEMSDFEEYLWNRHAEERNQQIASINPQMQDGGSGLKTADAHAYLAALPVDKRKAYESLAKRIDAINAKTRQVLVDSGLEKQSTIDAWQNAYQHYVPLQREDVETGGNGTGQGFSIRGSASKRAVGSNKPVADILANIAQQRERTVVRAEKNRVSNALFGLAMSQPNPEFWKVDEAPTERVVEKVGGQDQVVERVVPGFRSRDNVVLTRINGEDHYVIFNEQEPRALRMAQALKNLDADQLGRVLSAAGKATRYFASINTQFNPIFGIINLIRDTQGALLNLSTTPIRGEQKKVLGYTVDALRGIYADVRAHRAGQVPTSAWAQLWEEFQKEGGQTGYRDQYANAEARAEAILTELRRAGEGKAKHFGRAVFGWLSDYNETMENAVRLAAYRTAKEQGLSNAQAASVAKNLTVNFNRKGQVATQVGALYAFFNASVQGTARLAETLAGPMGRKIVTGGLLLGGMQALLLAAAGMGDDEPPEFVRERNMILPIGDGKYLTLPMPLGFHVLPNLGRIPMEFAMSGFKAPAKRIADLFGLFADTFNPIGNAGISLQTIAPTVVDPFAALAENRDWTGKPITRADMNPLSPTPGHSRAKDTATTWSKAIAYGINWLSGGTEFKAGIVSPTPDQIDYLIGQATGGVGREAAKLEQTVSAALSGEDMPLYKVPLVGRFVGDTTGQSAEGGKFYEAIKRINEHENELKGLRAQGRVNEAREYLQDNPEARLVMAGNYIEREMQKLRKAKRQAVESGDTEGVKSLDQQITSRMRQFNERVALLQ